MVDSQRPSRRDVLPAWAWLVVLGAGLIGGTALATAPGVPLAVLGPLAASVCAVLVLLLSLWRRRRGRVPFFEIGVFYAAVVLLYTVYPLCKFLAVGEGYSDVARDSRWSTLSPRLDEVVSLGWVYAAHLSAFVTAYLVVRRRVPIARPTVEAPPRGVFLAAVALYLLVQAFWIYLGLFFDTSADSYVESYTVSRRLPLILAQLLNHLNGAKYPLSLVILTSLFARYRETRPYIAAWVGALALLTVVRLGSRTELALLLVSTAMLYDRLVRPLTPRLVVTGAVAGVSSFLLLGMLRGGGGAAVNPFFYASEFDVLFSNALELARREAEGTLGSVPQALYWADLAALLPQQIAPFEKVDPAAWYVNRFYPEYAALGGGLAFGTMAEAVLTGGWISALLRGAALGGVFAAIHRVSVRRGDAFWAVVLAVWATTLSYQAFRATTFFLLGAFAFRFLPVWLGARGLSYVLERSAARSRVASVGGPAASVDPA